MARKEHPNSAGLLFVGWATAFGAACFAPMLITIGQGLGSLIGGCEWIGLSTPIDRQPWALVNQPSIAFSSQAASIPYWLGGPLAVLAWAALVLPLMPRPRRTVWELVAVQASWMASVVGVCWYALVDLWDGHVSRLLILHDLPPALVWVFPVVGAWCALLPATRLLAIARGSEQHPSRAGRLWTVVLHLVAPALVWIAAATWIRMRPFSPATSGDRDLSGFLSPVWLPAVGASLPIIAALLLAWVAYPKPWTRTSTGGKAPALLAIGALSGLLLFLQWYAGGPAAENARRGILWSDPGARNNIRPWITTPRPLQTTTQNETE